MDRIIGQGAQGIVYNTCFHLFLFIIAPLPYPSNTNMLSDHGNMYGLFPWPVFKTILLSWTGFLQSAWTSDMLTTTERSPMADKSSMLLSAGTNGVNELQSTVYHSLAEQCFPIPKGGKIRTLPNLFGQFGL